jgi:hypothetical protein
VAYSGTLTSKAIKLSGSENRKEQRFYVYVIAMLTLLFLRNAIGINIPVVVLLFLTAIPALFGSPNEIVATAACCIPMSTGFQYKYVLFLCIIGYFAKKGSKLKVSNAVYPIAAMMAWELLHAFIGDFSVNEYLRGFAELLLLVAVTSMDFSKINYKLIFRSLTYATVGVCLIMLYLQLTQSNFSLAAVLSRNADAFRFGEANTTAENYGLNFNANALGYVCTLSITGMLFLFTRKEHTILDSVMLMFCVLFGLMTLSRTAIFCMIFVAICYIFISPSSTKKKVFAIFGSIMAIAIVAAIIGKFTPQIYQNILSRFRVEDVTSGRSYLLVFYNKHIFSSVSYMLFGIGLQDFQGKLSNIYGYNVQVPHNGLQEIIVVWGFVGAMLLVWLIIALIKGSRRFSGKRDIISYVPMGLWILYTSAGQLIRSEFALLSLTLLYVYLCIGKVIK